MPGDARDIDELSMQSATVSEDAHAQEGGTCYAHAAATAIRAVEERIVGRTPQKFATIKDSAVKKYGDAGADTFKVLREQCKRRNLRCKKVAGTDVLGNLEDNRVVVASFQLADYQWTLFNKFISENVRQVLCASDLQLDPKRFPPMMREKMMSEGVGHSIVITEVEKGNKRNKPVYKIKNSWGEGWGDNGYFYIEADCLPFDEFIEVGFYVSDLTSADIRNYLNQRLKYKRGGINVRSDGSITVNGCDYRFKVVSAPQRYRGDIPNKALLPVLQKLHKRLIQKDDITVHDDGEIEVITSKHRFRLIHYFKPDEDSTASCSD